MSASFITTTNNIECTCVDPSNNLYITTFSPSTVTKYNANTGASISFSLGGGYSSFIGVAADGSNNLYVVSNNSGIYKYNATTGAVIGQVLPPNGSPFGCCVDSNNNLYVTYINGAGDGTGFINKYLAGGSTVITFISNLWNPQSVYVDKQNNLYVSNLTTTSTGKIGKYNATTGAVINSSFIIVPSLGSIIGDNNNNLYAYSGASIQQYNITTGALTNSAFVASANGVSLSISASANYLYMATADRTLGKYALPSNLPIDPVLCFKEDTQILTDKGYVLIQELKNGDLVKTSIDGFKPIYKIRSREIYQTTDPERLLNKLYKCSLLQYPELTEDLIITGCHSILVDDFVNKEQRDHVIKINGDTYVTDTKYRLPACADYRASIYDVSGKHTIYHIALEHEDEYMNYGIYANGLCVESCSKIHIVDLF